MAIKFKLSMGKRVLIGAIFGLLLGFVMRGHVSSEVFTYFKNIGDIFIKLVQMIVLPLIFCAIVSALLSITDMKVLGNAAKRGFMVFMITNVVAVIFGLLSSYVFNPGVIKKTGAINAKIVLSDKVFVEASKVDGGIVQRLFEIIPNNIFQSFCNANTLQVIFFAILIGFAILKLEDSGNFCGKLIQSTRDVMYKMVGMVMNVAPFGIFGFLTWIVGTQDLETLMSLLKLIICSIVTLFLLTFVFYPLALSFRFRVNPFTFIKKMFPVQMLALATGSSAATLPMNMKNAHEKLGASKETVDVLMPIGTSMDMNGSACCLAIYVVFVSQLFGIHLDFYAYFNIGLVCLLSSLGSPPVPGGAVIMLSGVLISLNYPVDALSLIFAIDKVIALFRTVCNVTGECFSVIYVDLIGKKVDLSVYNQKN